MKRSILSFIIVILFISSVQVKAEKMRVAVLDLQPKGVSKILAGAVTDIIRSEMVKTGLYTIIERARMDAILKEQELQMSGCTDQACAVQIGKILSARKILLGEINKIGKTFIITVRIVDVESATSEFSANEKAVSEDKLDVAAKNITINLSRNIAGGNKEFFIEKKTPAGYYARSIIPGWGQLYVNQDTKGYLFLGGFGLAAGFTIYSYLNYSKAAQDYQDVPRGSPQSEFDSKYDDKKSAAQMLLLAGGITTAIYIGHWIDIVYFSKPDFETGTGYNSRKKLFYNISCYPVPGNEKDRITAFSAGLRF